MPSRRTTTSGTDRKVYLLGSSDEDAEVMVKKGAKFDEKQGRWYITKGAARVKDVKKWISNSAETEPNEVPTLLDESEKPLPNKEDMDEGDLEKVREELRVLKVKHETLLKIVKTSEIIVLEKLEASEKARFDMEAELEALQRENEILEIENETIKDRFDAFVHETNHRNMEVESEMESRLAYSKGKKKYLMHHVQDDFRNRLQSREERRGSSIERRRRHSNEDLRQVAYEDDILSRVNQFMNQQDTRSRSASFY